MFRAVFSFELSFHLRSRLFLFSAIVFFLLTFLGVASPNVQFGNLGGANYNSPLAIVLSHLIMGIFAVLVGTAFYSSAALRDQEFRMSGIVFSTGIDRFSYVLARFLGAFLATYLAYLATALGFFAGTLMPWLDQELIGPFVLSHYAYAALVVGLPALFANSAIVYAVAVLSRDQRIAYAAIIGLLVIYQVASGVLGSLEYRELAALVDPTAGAALADATQYWTIFERNSQLVPVEGMFLANRLLWGAVGVVMLGVTLWRFRFENAGERRSRKQAPDQPVSSLSAEVASFPRRSAVFDNGTAWRQFLSRVRVEVQGVLRSVFFWVLVALAVANSVGSFFGLVSAYGTEVYPVTRVLINLMSGTATLSLLVLTVLYGAELVWRDREVRFQDILGSTPTPGWAFVLAKIVAGLMVVVVFLATSAVSAILFQLFSGYTRLELELYLVGFFFDYAALPYLMMLLSVIVQIIAPNKYLGMLIMVVYILGILVLPGAGFEDPLYLYGFSSATPYSDMNGYDGQLGIALWYNLYWACFAALLGVFAYLVWMRGPEEKLRVRLRGMGANAGLATRRIALAAGLGFVGLGSWIFYNTHVLNEYVTADDQREKLAEYERRFIHLESQAIPRITDISMEVDLYPRDQAFSSRGLYSVENKSGAPITEVPVGFAWSVEVESVSLEGAELIARDADYNVFTFRFEPALQPGERRDLHFLLTREPRGFVHRDNLPDLLSGGGVFGNGSFVNSATLGPYLGFARGILLTDRADRAREGLESTPRAADLDAEAYWNDSYLRQDSDWVSFEMTVTTEADQIAIAPGYLTEERLDPPGESQGNGRRRFHYRMDAPMQNLYAVLSARYAAKIEEWNGTQLAVYYHPAHHWNVDRMMHSLKASLAYFGDNFSPYQYRQMRVLEFPGYSRFAQSFPNTVPWSESIGFIADITDPETIDYVFYVGAHEVAHQWWGHQVSSANVQGQTTLVETLAQYSALMVMEREYGPHMMRRFLKFELDNYLSGRGGEAMEELPLYRVENQAYIHYRKGSLVMYAIKDALGEAAVNRALSKLVSETAYRHNPYPRSRDLIRHLRAEAATEDQQALITDLFEKIVLWDLKVEEAVVSEREDGAFDVAVTIASARLEADGEGRETEVPMDMPVDIGIFSQDPDDVVAGEGSAHVLHFEKHRLTGGEQQFSFIAQERPSHVGIDPYNKLIDRNSDDNIKAVSGG
jgi:hypothetical protein